MTPRTDAAPFTETIQHLSRLRQYRLAQPPISHAEMDASLLRLRAWQSARLAQTHADLLESHRYGPACRFFLDEIYAPRDFSQRDQDIEYLYAIMSSFLPEFLIKVVRKAIAPPGMNPPLAMNEIKEYYSGHFGEIELQKPFAGKKHNAIQV